MLLFSRFQKAPLFEGFKPWEKDKGGSPRGPPPLALKGTYRSQWASPDLGEILRAVGLAGPQRLEKEPYRMPKRMPDRMSEDMPDRMSEDIPDRICQIECQIECQKICQIECQKIFRIGYAR